MKNKKKISVTLSERVLEWVDQEVQDTGRPRSEVLEDLANAAMARREILEVRDPRRRVKVRDALLSQSEPLKELAAAYADLGERAAADAAYLLAAAKELEALAVLRDPSEETVRDKLIDVIALIKKGTGYKHLPDVPTEVRRNNPLS